MNFSRLLIGLSLILFISCKNNVVNDPNTDALLTEFSIKEIPNGIFDIDNENGIIKLSNRNSVQIPVDISSLTAVFIVSDGAELLVEDQVQISGDDTNSFERGLFYKVVSEDEQTSKEYYVYLNKDLPGKYFHKDDYDLIYNPSGFAPLSAGLGVVTRVPTSVRFKVLGDIPIEKELGSFSIHLIGIHGLYADSNNEIEITFTDGNGLTATDTLEIQTDPLPDFFPEIEIDVLDESRMEPGMHFSEVHIGNQGKFNTYPMIFDNNGDIRWYIDFSDRNTIVWPIQFNDDLSFYAASGVTIHEFNMFGEATNNIIVDFNNMHHDIIKLPNGNYLAAVSKEDEYITDSDSVEFRSVEDFVIEVDKNTGEILREWDMAELLDIDRRDFNDPGNGDWFHMNAVWYHEADSSLIISGRNQGVVKVSWDNELEWILAPHKGWGKAGRKGGGPETTPFLLTAVDDSGTPFNEDIQNGTFASNDFDWTWGQHAPLILPNGNVLVFDNGGFNRNFGNYTSIFSAATEYEIDEDNKTIKEVWSYGKERGESTYSLIISDVDYLSETGNILFAPGNITEGNGKSKIVEVAYPSKDVVFESTMIFKNQLGNGAGFGNVDISYRAERISIYR